MSHLYRGIAIILLLFISVSSFAQEMTPIEGFIYRLKNDNYFSPVNNIWTVDGGFDKTAMLTKVEKAQALTINYTNVASLIKKNQLTIALTVPGLDGTDYVIELGRYNILSNDFKIHTKGNNTDGTADYTPGVYYRGTVKGIKGSVAAFSFFNNEVYGIFSIPGEGNYTLVPNTMVGKYYDYNTHYVLYNDRDLLIKDKAPVCDGDNYNYAEKDPAQKTTTIANNKAYATCNDVRVFEVADYSLYTDKGSSTTNVTNYLTALFNNQAVLYRNEQISILLNYVQIDTTTDDYMTITTASSHAFLSRFGHNTQNVLHNSDLAILLSSRLSGGYGALGGVAWLMSMCGRYRSSDSGGAYGFCNMDNSAIVNFPTYSWDVEVIAHEMGHIVGSPHTHRCCWNPSGSGTTAIDGCYTIEGTCADPGVPSSTVGGTIMSYCHLTSTGINFANGFGRQPGDTVRSFLTSRFTTGCGMPYNVSKALATPNRVISANRECYDSYTQTTYYWNDNNSDDRNDDTLVLKIKKNSNNIGDLNTTGFSVSTGTNTLYHTGTGQRLNFPAGTAGVTGTNYAMRRYWKLVTPTASTTSAIEIFYPFTAWDSADVNGSLSSATIALTKFQLYKTTPTIDPNPLNGLSGASSANITIYDNAAASSTTKWALSKVGTTSFASFKTTTPGGGGSVFLSSNYMVGVSELSTTDEFQIYPNPTADNWNISTGANTGIITVEVYDASGRMLHKNLMNANSVNAIGDRNYAPGVYYYRIITANNTYTGSLLKK